MNGRGDNLRKKTVVGVKPDIVSKCDWVKKGKPS